MRAGFYPGCIRQRGHGLRAGDPFPHLATAGDGFIGQVDFLEQSAVVAIAWIDE